MTFQVVLADPAWRFDDKLGGPVARGAEANYPVMSNEDIMALPVRHLVDPAGAILALWVPSSILDVGLDVMRAWGFTLKSTFIWVKTTKEGWAPEEDQLWSYGGMGEGLGFGMGHGFRQTHEVALIGTCGKFKTASRSERSVMLAYNEGHSKKPEELHRRLERMAPGGPYLELYARRRVPGWTTVGNEIDGRDIRDALADLMFD